MRGMTWDHPRGIDPLLAASRTWQEQTGQDIQWDRRSLQDFETFPVEELARQYDLIVIDHPHVGQVADAGCLVPLGTVCDVEALAAIEAGSVGLSYPSYHWKGHQWALPIDAATQVQAWVPGRLAGPLHTWDDVLALARTGGLGLPLRAPHSLMSLFSLCGLEGVPLDVQGPDLFPAAAASAYDRLLQLAELVDPVAYDQDPIALLDAMGAADSVIAGSPLMSAMRSMASARRASPSTTCPPAARPVQPVPPSGARALPFPRPALIAPKPPPLPNGWQAAPSRPTSTPLPAASPAMPRHGRMPRSTSGPAISTGRRGRPSIAPGYGPGMTAI